MSNTLNTSFWLTKIYIFCSAVNLRYCSRKNRHYCNYLTTYNCMILPGTRRRRRALQQGRWYFLAVHAASFFGTKWFLVFLRQTENSLRARSSLSGWMLFVTSWMCLFSPREDERILKTPNTPHLILKYGNLKTFLQPAALFTWILFLKQLRIAAECVKVGS